MRIASLVALSLISLVGCTRDGHDGGAVCHEAAELCGASDDFDEDDCTGEPKAYAECIVDRGDCEPATAAECAQGGGGGGDGADGGPSSGAAAIELTVESFTAIGDGYLDVSCRIANVGESEPVPVGPGYFQVEDDAHNLHLAGGGICHGGELLATGGSELCDLQFTIGAAVPVSLVFRDPAGREADASFDGVCSVGFENNPAVCSDGCSNDDDSYIDCDDYDCCDVVDCPSSSSCGQM